MASNDQLGSSTQLKFCTGVVAKYREVDIRHCVQVISKQKAQGLIKLHNFSGADWGGGRGSLLEYLRKDGLIPMMVTIP